MPPPATTFEFIISDPLANPKPGKSLQIRRKCMQGKNKREGSRRSQREKRRQALEDQNKALEEYNSQQPVEPYLRPQPGSLISELAVIRFAGPGIDNEAKAMLFKAFAYNVANQSLSPLDRCVDFDCLEHESFEFVFNDTAFLHSVLCASYAISDFLAPNWDGHPGRKTLFHLRETLALLQVKMQDENAYQDESVLQVIINLGLLSAVFGDWDAAAAHFKGLHKIIQLRGDLHFLRDRPKLHFKLDRLDLAWSLSSGKKPFFLHPSVTWNASIPPPYLPLPPTLCHPSRDWDFRLINVFHDLQYLALRINKNALRRARHNPACFHAVLSSLQSRLMHLGEFVTTPLEQLVRLSMLAFLTTTFKVPGRRIPYRWVIENLKAAYNSVDDYIFEQHRSIRTWALMTAAFTVSNHEQQWISDAWGRIDRPYDWPTMKLDLMRVMWIELIHDKPGELVFQQLEDVQLLR